MTFSVPTTEKRSLFTNADTIGRLDQFELYEAAKHDVNLGIVEDADRIANLKRLARDYKPTILRGEVDPLSVVRDGQVEAFTHVTPEWIIGLSFKDVLSLDRLPVAAWIPDRGWPWKMRPALDNDHSWQAVFDGAFCVRCCNKHVTPTWPEDGCPACKLPREVARKALELIEHRLKIASEDFNPVADQSTRAGAVPVLS